MIQNTINETNYIEILETEINTLRHELAVVKRNLHRKTKRHEGLTQLLIDEGYPACDENWNFVDIIRRITEDNRELKGENNETYNTD